MIIIKINTTWLRHVHKISLHAYVQKISLTYKTYKDVSNVVLSANVITTKTNSESNRNNHLNNSPKNKSIYN